MTEWYFIARKPKNVSRCITIEADKDIISRETLHRCVVSGLKSDVETDVRMYRIILQRMSTKNVDDKEIFMDVNLHHYPLRDYCRL